MSEAVGLHIITVASILTFKLGVLIVGYFVMKLGHDLFIKGVTGSFEFKGSWVGARADLVSASPGLFFILMGTFLVAVGIVSKNDFESRLRLGPPDSVVSAPESKYDSVSLPSTPPFGDIP